MSTAALLLLLLLLSVMLLLSGDDVTPNDVTDDVALMTNADSLEYSCTTLSSIFTRILHSSNTHYNSTWVS